MYTIQQQAHLFESIIAEIFEKANYKVTGEAKHGTYVFDLLVQKDELTYAVEIKYINREFISSLAFIERSMQRFVEASFENEYKPVLVISENISKRVREEYKQRKKFEKLLIIDVANLLYITREDQKMRDKLVALLPRVVDEIEPEKPESININCTDKNDPYDDIVKELNICPVGKKYSTQFEKACESALKYVFKDDLALWLCQKTSNNSLYRFDLLCKIKDGSKKGFWDIAERYFRSKYILFEFKNYGGRITQNEIYTTEKYLYLKALRSISIIISAKGADRNARIAAKGVFRESGKLILLLDKDELIKMCEMKKKQDDPTNYLQDKLDSILVELEK